MLNSCSDHGDNVMIRSALLIAFLVSLSACANPTPTSPSSTFTVSGTVYDVRAQAVAGASVTIMDGIHAGQTRTTGAAGTFSFTDLTPSSFTLQARTRDGLAENKTVNLTANRSVDFQLINYCSLYPDLC
jgi:hypothetical protein